MNTDSSNSHSHDINNRSNNDPSHPNKSSNFEYRNKHEYPPNIPPPAPSLFKPGNERHEWRKRFRKKNTVPPPRASNLPPLPHLPFPFFSANLSAEKSPL